LPVLQRTDGTRSNEMQSVRELDAQGFSESKKENERI
jgi:hypothetical protein